MTMQDDARRQGADGAREQTNVGRLANTSVNPNDTSANPRAEAPIASPAQAVAKEDLREHPETADGSTDQARIVPPANQGDSAEVTEHIVGGEAGSTVY